MLALERHVCYFLEYGSAFMTSQVSLAFIGFGEAGLAIAETLSASGLATGMRAHDIKLTDHDHEIVAAMRARISARGMRHARVRSST